MFTGLVEEVGIVREVSPRRQGAHLRIEAATVLEGTRVGDSIAVNGPCLTVVAADRGSFVADCMPETLERSTLGGVRPGDRVNLERALALGERLGGHLVSGHVDGVGEVTTIDPRGIASELRITMPTVIRPFVAAKGSIAVDGISLTVIEVAERDFVVGIIPHTLGATTLGDIRPGARVNLEADVLARYVHRALALGVAGRVEEEGGPPTGGEHEDRTLTQEFLRGHGFA